MNLNKYVVNNNIPFNIINSYLVNFYIDEVLDLDNGQDKLLLIRMLVSINDNPSDLFKDGKSFDYALVDITTSDFKIKNMRFIGNKKTLISKIISFKYIEDTNEYELIYTRNDKDIFSINFEAKSLKYEIKTYGLNRVIKRRNIDDEYIYKKKVLPSF